MGPARALDPAHQVFQAGDQRSVLGLVVGHAAAEIEPDRLLLTGSRFRRKEPYPRYQRIPDLGHRHRPPDNSNTQTRDTSRQNGI